MMYTSEGVVRLGHHVLLELGRPQRQLEEAFVALVQLLVVDALHQEVLLLVLDALAHFLHVVDFVLPLRGLALVPVVDPALREVEVGDLHGRLPVAVAGDPDLGEGEVDPGLQQEVVEAVVVLLPVDALPEPLLLVELPAELVEDVAALDFVVVQLRVGAVVADQELDEDQVHEDRSELDVLAQQRGDEVAGDVLGGEDGRRLDLDHDGGGRVGFEVGEVESVQLGLVLVEVFLAEAPDEPVLAVVLDEAGFALQPDEVGEPLPDSEEDLVVSGQLPHQQDELRRRQALRELLALEGEVVDFEGALHCGLVEDSELELAVDVQQGQRGLVLRVDFRELEPVEPAVLLEQKVLVDGVLGLEGELHFGLVLDEVDEGEEAVRVGEEVELGVGAVLGLDGRQDVALEVVLEVVLGVVDALVLDVLDLPGELPPLVGEPHQQPILLVFEVQAALVLLVAVQPVDVGRQILGLVELQLHLLLGLGLLDEVVVLLFPRVSDGLGHQVLGQPQVDVVVLGDLGHLHLVHLLLQLRLLLLDARLDAPDSLWRLREQEVGQSQGVFEVEPELVRGSRLEEGRVAEVVDEPGELHRWLHDIIQIFDIIFRNQASLFRYMSFFPISKQRKPVALTTKARTIIISKPTKNCLTEPFAISSLKYPLIVLCRGFSRLSV